MKRIFSLLTIWWLISGTDLLAQLSEGGTPRLIPALKVASLTPIRMPYVSNDLLRWQNSREGLTSGLLKPLTFAHTFQVNISAVTHGNWIRSSDGWWIWRVEVHSRGALSLNLLFEEIHLPPKARLFLFTPDQSGLIGAFTASTISDPRIFTTQPLPGDALIVQYEIPYAPDKDPDFLITGVNHDFLGILKYTDTRRPMGVTAGECNMDVRCKAAGKWEETANSVCRVMVLGKDLCTGTLLNNTLQNKKPYILTANHCINTPLKASGTLFLFNYESPYCGSIDGDVTNSLSGSKLKATLDSLDFALVELNTAPPPALRPYYAGWSKSTSLADTMVSVHHPQGDIKKIAIDNDRPVTATFLSSFIKNAFWKVQRWEVGTTEIGSSGGPLFNKSGQLTGTLSGGAAVCGDPVNDYFSRFDIAWNYKQDSTRQLKHWLDPSGTNPVSLSGKQFNSGEQFCDVLTNLAEGDVHKIIKPANSTGGYWSGTNKDGITEVADKFAIPGDVQITGVSIGVGKKYQINSANNSYITLKVYNLTGSSPELLAVKDTIMLKNLAEHAMNYVKFNTPVEPADSFLIAINFDNVRQGDSLAIYQSVRPSGSVNSFWLKKNGGWVRFNEIHPLKYSGSLALEVLACNLGGNSATDTLYYPQDRPVLVWPNPAVSVFQVQVAEDVGLDKVAVYNSRGQLVRCRIEKNYPRHLVINMKDQPGGLYFIRVENRTAKVLLISH